MSGIKAVNNGYTELASGISASDPSPLTISLTAGHGARLPAVSTVQGSWFVGALINEPPNDIEFVKVYNRSTDTLTGIRAWGGTTAKDWSSGARFVAISDEATSWAEFLDLMQLRNLVSDVGSANANAASLVTARILPVTGMRVRLRVNFTNTTDTPTFNLTFDATTLGGTTTTMGAKRIVLEGDNFVGPGDLTSGQFADLIYNDNYQDGDGAWVLQNPVGVRDAPGALKMYAGSALPKGAWFACDGSIKSQFTYQKLFAAIGSTFSRGDEGFGNFRLPDFSGRFPVGAGTATTLETVTSSSGDGFFVSNNTRKWLTGMPVVLSALSGFTGVSAGPTYYVVRMAANNIRLASTLELAQELAPDIVIGGSGSALVTHTMEARSRGEYGGEHQHAQSVTEMPKHTHGYRAGALSVNKAVNEALMADTNAYTATPNSASETGGNAHANLLPPFIGVNYAIHY